MFRRLVRYLRPQRFKLAALFVTMLGSAGVEMLQPWPLKIVVDNVLGQQPIFGRALDEDLRGLALIAAALSYVLLAVFSGSLAILNGRWVTEISQKAGLALSSELYAQVQRLSLLFHDRARVGDMVTRITGDVEQLEDAFVSGMSALSMDAFAIVGMAAIMLLVDWQFGLVALLVVPPLLLTFATFRGRVRTAARAVRSSEGARASLAQEALSAIRVVKAFGQEDRERERFLDQARSRVEASIRAITWEGALAFVVDVITAVGIAIALGYGGWRVLHNDLTLGSMLLFMQYLRSLYNPLRGFSRLTILAQRAGASAERIDELFRAAPEVPEAPQARSLARARGDITFEDVWFAFEPGRPVLRGVHVRISAGERLALVGSTGAGKSTLASLIPRLYDAAAGRVLIDGIDVRDLRVQSLRAQISIVLQDSILFSGSIRDNIAYGRPAATDREVVECAQAAHAHEFIVDLPDGYESRVGERGATLSGGQRQRIAIARALLKDAPILLLDEPTSAIDRESEASVMRGLERLLAGRTVLIITHRASLAALADRVAVLADGVVVEVDRPRDLEVVDQPRERLHAQAILREELA